MPNVVTSLSSVIPVQTEIQKSLIYREIISRAPARAGATGKAYSLVDEATARRWLEHFEAMNRRGAFCCTIIVYTCAGTRP